MSKLVNHVSCSCCGANTISRWRGGEVEGEHVFGERSVTNLVLRAGHVLFNVFYSSLSFPIPIVQPSGRVWGVSTTPPPISSHTLLLPCPFLSLSLPLCLQLWSMHG